MGKIARVVRIIPLGEVDEDKKGADYWAGCLAMSTKERVDEVSRLSRRVMGLNPGRPRPGRAKSWSLTIVHDTF